MMWWYGPGMNGWGYGLMTISMVLFWALIIFGIVALIRYIGRAGQVSTDRPTPRRLLDERFARGEIDEEEYRRRVDVITADTRPRATS
ncbi:SHOCT domain-containing protein [Actinomycetospora lemnae]|uniref:SHOCT domain-containing protein n=1 Tax=Actinomycetospora lemnae TaxID=3019891 RepID=A0ABT5T2M6_9PSEU|nr:SHOCT domain-containing protein [Actinomycetospora sp. DW7H6]MDD7969375.1 SHOCT domain-containing protein [Actinomycetospora sp. DW7H6]